MNEQNRIEVSQLSGSAGYVTLALITERRLTDQGVIQELGGELDALLGENRPKDVLLNCGRIDFISSAALNRLINYNVRIKKIGGRLKLTNLKPQIEEVFAMTRLNRQFDIHPDEATALASY